MSSVDSRGAFHRGDEAVALRIRLGDVSGQRDRCHQPASAADVVGHLPRVCQSTAQPPHAGTCRTTCPSSGSQLRSILDC